MIVAVVTFVNFAYYFIVFSMPWNCERSIRHLLKDVRHRRVLESECGRDVDLVCRFANQGMCNDGVLLFWFIESWCHFYLINELKNGFFFLILFILSSIRIILKETC